MQMKVLKFGGTSISNAENISKVVDILLSYKKRKESFAVVFSAIAGITNMLVEAGIKASASDESYQKILKDIEKKHFETIKELLEVKTQSMIVAQIKMLINELEDLLHGVYLLKELSPRTLDLVSSFGERMSTLIISEHLKQTGTACNFVDARTLIQTDDSFGNAKVNFKVTNKNIQEHFEKAKGIQIVTGFIASTDKGETTTLGRGGSDYTASIIGAALSAEAIVIWTDVNGVMTADPRSVKRTFTLPAISYVEAMELSHFGAKVIHPPTLQPAFNKKIHIWIKNTFNPDFEGTLISEKTKNNDFLIKGISSISDVALINLQGSGMMGVPGVSSRVFGALARKSINVILITQASSEYSICFAVAPEDALKAQNLIELEFEQEMIAKKIERVHVEKDLSIVALIGENMKKTPGIAGRMFTALGKNGINVIAIAQGSSELNISVVIPKYDLSKGLNALHEAFFLSDIKTLNIFVVGLGLIGSTLMKQIEKASPYLLKEKSLKINVIAVSNSKKMIFDENGINLKTCKDQLLEKGQPMEIGTFIKEMKKLNLENSVFVDNTSSKDIVQHYEEVLKNSISIVTPNKLANSDKYKDYEKLQKTCQKYKARFLYETNVGAGLPVINTLRDLKYSGDKIIKIEGILSGTLSYIFNNFKKGRKFVDIVKEAKENGFTEPDPRDDLNGMDVARKILILAREAGYAMEPSDVVVENILPESCLKAKSVDDFFIQLDKNNAVFEEKLDKAEKDHKVLRFIAKLEDGKATVNLESVGAEHPFYNLSGSDNMISFTTDRYKERPLVIKGPGAGAEVTAAGVFAEIISISNYLKS
jgi:aspartokinase/homoserine dehydrogenase 1